MTETREDPSVDDVAPAPVVSVLLPVLNEEAEIGEVLDRLLAQSFTATEVIVADGGSVDRTRQIVADYASRDPRVRMVDNPGRLQSAGLNRAFKAARGEVLVRLDGHAFVTDDYVARNLDLLESSGAEVVGGRMVARAVQGRVAGGIEMAMGRRWAAGPARFHHPGPAAFVETVYLGTFRREILERVGGWSENVGVNEDFDLNYRIRRAGGRIWYDPTLEVGYRPRSTIKALSRQYFRYGRSKGSMLRKRPGSILPRQLAPAVLLPIAVVSAAPGRPGRLARRSLWGYALALAVAVERERDVAAPVRRTAGVAAAVMHWCWSAGLWVGLVSPFPDVAGGQ
jgi:glycosyltransferase involved in cell wall biosynthesis